MRGDSQQLGIEDCWRVDIAQRCPAEVLAKLCTDGGPVASNPGHDSAETVLDAVTPVEELGSVSRRSHRVGVVSCGRQVLKGQMHRVMSRLSQHMAAEGRLLRFGETCCANVD